MSIRDEYSIRSGPPQLTDVDWNDAKHRRSVMASLVRGVTLLECDRQQRKEESQAQAPPWWEHFHFELRELLKVEYNNTQNPIIFGAIFEFMFPTTHNHRDKAPTFVIALRGTMLKKATRFSDLEQDYGILINNLHQSPRYQSVLSSAMNRVHSAGVHKVWLAGHSLGAAIALLVGKEMARGTYPLETYLFNPPFVSLSLEWMNCSEKVKQSINLARTTIRAALAAGKSLLGDSTAGGNESEDSKRDPFADLKDWKPYLFLNSRDIICSHYMRYFKTRKIMKKMKILRDVEKIATRNTIIRDLLTGKWDNEQEPIHLLASAELAINKKWSSVKKAHELRQWWNPDEDFKSKLYDY